jgi:hypothetical protein
MTTTGSTAVCIPDSMPARDKGPSGMKDPMQLWRQVLAALHDGTLDDGERERILAHGAAELATHRAAQGTQATPQEVMAVAFAEFSLLLDADQACLALREARLPRG